MKSFISIPIRTTFIILILFQGLHSIEEYIGKLWKIFSITELFRNFVFGNIETCFIVINIGLFIFGLWCWLVPVRRNYIFARKLIWFWIVIEMMNGIGHSILAIYKRAYIPGVATSPILLITAVYLIHQLLRNGPGLLERNDKHEK